MNITVYTTSTCPYCVMVKNWLGQKNLKFNEVRVDTDQTAAQEMIKLSGQMGVPFTTIEKDDGNLVKVLGFDVQRLTNELGVA